MRDWIHQMEPRFMPRSKSGNPSAFAKKQEIIDDELCSVKFCI